MRRVLLAVAVALPMGALAVTAPNGQVVEITNFDPTVGTGGVSYVNKAHCDGTAQLQLEWLIANTGFAQGDLYKLFASDTDPRGSTTGECAVKDETTPTTIHAGPVGSIDATTALASTSIAASTVVGPAATSATDVTCDAGSENTNVFICAHWTSSGGATKGVAVGQFQVQLLAPNAPGGVSVEGGDSTLRVSWTANGTSPTRTHHYVARAYLAGSPDVVKSSPDATGNSTTITDLENGIVYDVDVVAFSPGGNPSPPSPKQVNVMPVPSGDFWDVYKARGGVEQGGCASGSAGTLALLGVASLVAMRRRKS
jgi:MYXO-CTERM domain-containing protein